MRDEEGRIIETPRKMMKRVARAVAEVDARYGKDVDKAYSEFYEMLTSLLFAQFPYFDECRNSSGAAFGLLCFTSRRFHRIHI